MAHEDEQKRPTPVGQVERPVRPRAWMGQPGFFLERTREAVEYKTRKDDQPQISGLYDEETIDQLLSDIKGLCNLSRKLLGSAPENADAFYLKRLLKHCNDEYGA